jgi:serine/threonine protein kinase
LLLRWEEAKAVGRVLSPEELCADQPELLELVRYRIAKLEAVNEVLEGHGGATRAATVVAAEPFELRTQAGTAWQPPGYEILEELGRGGMGVVYKARHVALDRIVAIKTIPATALAGPSALARFDIEARAVARLRHPHILQIYEVGSHAGCPFFSLEYMDGGSLGRLLQTEGLDLVAAARVAVILARAVHYAHSRGIVHRDLKPSNMLLQRTGLGAEASVPDPESVKIGDFGLARFLDENAVRLTRPGTSLGTPSYMAPEQAQGRSEAIGPATDVYGLGSVLYEMLCGHPPFHADSDWQTMHQVVTQTPEPVHTDRPDCPAPLEAICLRCLAKDPAERYRSAEALADDLQRFLDGEPISTPLGSRQSRRAWLAGTALAALSLGASAAWNVARRPGPIKVGVIQSQTEFMGESGQAVINATLAAIDEINRLGGVLGRGLRPIVADGQSDEVVFAREARRLIVEEDVSVLFAGILSVHRRAMEPVVQEFDRLLVYAGESEGLEQSAHVVCLGPMANQHVVPCVAWCRDALRKRRFYVVGSDGIYARGVRAILGDAAKALGMELVGESYVAPGDVVGWTVEVVRQIEAEGPDAIVSLIQGKANLAFIHRLRSRRITPDRIPTLSFTFTEHDLRNILREMVGDYLCGHYYQSVETAANARFLARLAADPRIGESPVVSDAMVAAYNGVHLWARALAQGGTAALADQGALRKALLAVSVEGPSGTVKLDPDVQCDAKFARVAQIGPDRRIAIVWSSPGPLKPIAYPATRTREQWNELVGSLHKRWGGYWSNRGYFVDPAAEGGQKA